MRKTWVQNIRDFFLRHNDLKSVILFILLSALMWTAMKLNRVYRMQIPVPVHYTDGAGHILPDSLFTDTLKLEIKTSGWQWLRAGWEKPELRLPFGSYTAKDLTRQFIHRFFNDTNVLQNSNLIINKGRKEYTYIKRMPARAKPRIVVPDGYAIRRMQIVPDTVTVLAEKNTDSTTMLNIEPEVFNAHANDSLLDFRWKQKPGRLIIPAGGKIKLNISPYARAQTDVAISIPAKWKNKIVIMPSTVTVHYKRWRSARPDTTTWKIGLLGKPGDSGKIRLQIEQKPGDVFDVELRPDRVDYLQIKQ